VLKFVKFAELPVADQDRAVAFYTEKIGLKVVQDAPYKQGWRWIELEVPGAETRIMLTQQPSGSPQDTPRLVFIADDVPGTYRELKKKGVVFTTEPTASPWSPGETFAQFRDSEGNGIVLTQPAR
jgi:lactoylglutathione lyase